MKESTKEGLDRFVSHGVPPGEFLQAVLSNDLTEAFGRADDDNLRDLREIVMYVHWELPSNCHGSRSAVANWVARAEQGPAGVARVAH